MGELGRPKIFSNAKKSMSNDTPTSQHLGANSNLLADSRVKALKLVIDLDNLEKVFPYFTQLNELAC